jgi:hypothetical protein
MMPSVHLCDRVAGDRSQDIRRYRESLDEANREHRYLAQQLEEAFRSLCPYVLVIGALDNAAMRLRRQNNLELLEVASLRSKLSEAEADVCTLRRALVVAEQQLAILEEQISEQHNGRMHLAIEDNSPRVPSPRAPVPLTTDSVSHIQEHLAAFLKTDFKNTRLTNIYFDDLYKRQIVCQC